MKRKIKLKKLKVRIFFLELVLFFLLAFFSISFFISNVFADIGEDVPVTGNLTIGKSNPNILSVNVEDGSITLIPNDTVIVNCSVIIEDYDGDTTLSKVNATFFDTTASFADDSDDNNYHYTNSSCVINYSYGDSYQVKTDCLFEVQYYSNPGNWNCSVYVEDISNYTDLDINNTQIQEMLAFGLPSTIDYGTINATFVSDEKIANVTNVGNVKANLSLSGYGQSEDDGYAMVCDYGASQNISVGFEKYNLTDSNSGSITYSQFEENYTNLTSTPFVNGIDLDYRTNETVNDRVNSTYWRVYVPIGVAGTCNGSIVFGAIKAVAG